MKHLGVLFLPFIFSMALSADTLDVASGIESVTVYMGVAKVTRSFEVDMFAGEKATLSFAGLPSDVNPGQVQVAVIEGAALDFGLASLDGEFRESGRSQTLRDLEQKQRELQGRLTELQRKKQALSDLSDSRLRLVDSINNGLAKQGNADLYELAKRAYQDAAAMKLDCDARAEALDSDIRDTSEALADAKRDVEKQREKERRSCGKYSVDAVSAGGISKGRISYYVTRAGWTPRYIVKADTGNGVLDISYLAQVYQNSGEDWRNVAMTLETSRPGRGVEPVEPQPVFLKQRESKRSAFLSRSDSDIIELAPFAVGSGADTCMSEAETLAGASGMTGFCAQIPAKATVESGADAVVLPLLDTRMPCEFHCETIPATSESAFLIAELKNAFELPMMQGAMQAIVDGSTNGEGWVEETLPGGDLVIGLGVNQNIVVERTVLKEKGGNSGIFGGKRVEERSYANRITNHMSVAQRVVVRDFVPLSGDEKIEVKLLAPKDAEVDPETGLFDQERTLQPGESVLLPTQYKVSYPSDWILSDEF